MGKYTVEQLEQWHASCNFDKDTLPNAKLLGCCFCRKTYTPSSIAKHLKRQRWSGVGYIFCPHCDTDIVIADGGTGEIDPQLLEEMYYYYFVRKYDPNDD